jgi:phage terminase small subunit
MPPLTAKQEAFAQALAAGASAAEAARAAGYTAKVALAKAAAMAKLPGVVQRVAELRGPIEVPREVPALAEMRLPELRRAVAAQAYEIAQEARDARDRRGAVAALSLLSDVLGLKSSALRLEQSDPFSEVTAVQAKSILALLEHYDRAEAAGRIEKLADGSLAIEVDAEAVPAG